MSDPVQVSLKKNGKAQLDLTEHGAAAVVEVCIILTACILFAGLTLTVHLVGGLHALLRLCESQPLTEPLVNVIFLLLTVLLWRTYRRWRKAQALIDHLLLTDELTGLYNRRSFLNLAEKQLARARRTKRPLYLVFIDLDGMKQINDTFGHQEGDQALVTTAQALRETFHDSAVIARLGGDEFVALATEHPDHDIAALGERLHATLDARNTKRENQYKLSVSTGIVRYDAEHHCPIDALLARADMLLYEQKRAKNPNAAEGVTGEGLDGAEPGAMVEAEATPA